MEMSQVLVRLGAGEHAPSESERALLDQHGYLPLRGMIEPAQIAAFRSRLEELIALEGDSAGSEVGQEDGSIRLSDLINKDPIFDFCYTHPRLLAAVRYILGDDFKVHSLNSRFSRPGDGLQRLHMDWGHADPALQARFQAGEYFVANSLWLLDDFSEENGATRLVPGSHHLKKAPGDLVEDPTAAHVDQTIVTEPAGTVVVFNGHTWHGGTVNRSRDFRRAMHMAFIRRELPQQTDQQQYLRPETAARLTAEMRVLLDVHCP